MDQSAFPHYLDHLNFYAIFAERIEPLLEECNFVHLSVFLKRQKILQQQQNFLFETVQCVSDGAVVCEHCVNEVLFACLNQVDCGIKCKHVFLLKISEFTILWAQLLAPY